MDEAWLSAASAYELVKTVIPYSAGEAICSRASDGLIDTRARRLICGDQSFDNCKVHSTFWWARGRAALSQNWSSGDFSTWIDHKVHCRAYGVEFLRADIESMLPKREGQPFQRSAPGNYAPAAHCLSELRTSLECSADDAQSLILRACQANHVPSRCSRISWRTFYRHGVDEEGADNVAIPDWFWEGCLDDSWGLLNWHTGRFTGRGYFDGDERRVLIEGVEFQVGAIVDLEAKEIFRRKTPAEASKTVSTRDATVRPLGARWPDWIAELVSQVHDSGFPEGIGSQGQEELIKRVADGLAKREIESLGRTTVQPIVQAVLDSHRSAGK